MTGYVVDCAVDKKKISRDDVVTVGKDAWAAGNPLFKGSSLMFLKPGDKATVRDLMRDVIIDSGNDACVALADYVAGSQQSFVDIMNSYVQKLGLTPPILKPCMAGRTRAAHHCARSGGAVTCHH